MNPSEAPEEPLKNIDLESAILGLKMALTPDEEVETRERFINQLKVSTLVVPTVTPVATNPDGSIAPNADITFVVVETPEGVTGVPGFTALAGLKASLPNVNNGVFLNGAQLASILSSSPHKLFIDGPDMHAEVDHDELVEIAKSVQQQMEEQQQAAERNAPLETALTAFVADDSGTTREAIVTAFLSGYCRIPIANQNDENAKVVIMRTGNPQDPKSINDVPLLTEDDTLLCFTSEAALNTWQTGERQIVGLPGPMIADLVAQTKVPGITVNRGSADATKLRIDENRLVVA